MSEKPTIMVQIADRAWTTSAVLEACPMARRLSAAIVLVNLIPVQHPAWLGTDWGYLSFNPQAAHDSEHYSEIVLGYGLDCQVVYEQYVDFTGGLANAAEHLNAMAVFAQLSPTMIPVWQHVQRWFLKRHLSKQHCQLVEPMVTPPATSTPDELIRALRHV